MAQSPVREAKVKFNECISEINVHGNGHLETLDKIKKNMALGFYNTPEKRAVLKRVLNEILESGIEIQTETERGVDILIRLNVVSELVVQEALDLLNSF